MTAVFTEMLQKIEAANGFGLALVGMSVVFSGLVILLIVMIILKKVVTSFELRTRGKKKKPSHDVRITSDFQSEETMSNIAAAICLALHLHKIRHKPRELTIQKKPGTPWKHAQRSADMERL